MRYFYCYSRRLMRALKDHGFDYICTGTNFRTGSIFWLFEASDELNAYKNNVYPTDRDNY